MLNSHILDNGFNHQVRLLDDSLQIGRSIHSLQHVRNEFIGLIAIVFELLFSNTSQAGFYAILRLLNQLIVDFNNGYIVSSGRCNLNVNGKSQYVEWTMDFGAVQISQL